jgi:hypothetical protein
MVMAMLCGDRYAPVTSSLGFLRAPLGEVSAALHQWRSKIHGSAELIHLGGGLRENVGRLEPLTGGVHPRELLVATRSSEWTAVLDCGVQGGDQVTTVGYLARTLLCQGVVVASIPDSEGGGGVPERLGARQFEMFGPVATDFINYVRTISLVRDGSRWRFDTAGTVQDFEDVGAYQRRKVVERFTPAMLTEYASALGLEPFQADFYPGPSALVVSPETPPPGALVLTIAEAQRWAGIEPR